MSIRIDTERLTGASASQTGQTEQARSGASRGPSGSSSTTYGRDSVEMSSLADLLTGTAGQADTERAGRISQLAALYASGGYQPDSMKVSQALVDHALQAAPAGG